MTQVAPSGNTDDDGSPPNDGRDGRPKVRESVHFRHFGADEIAKHNTVNDCWIVLHGRVYFII